MANIVSQISVHQQHEFLAKLEAAGLTGDLSQKVIESRGNALAKNVVNLIRGPQIDFPSYSVTVNYDLTVEQLIKAGKYDWVNDDVTSGHFPLNLAGTKKKEIVLLPIDSRMSTEAVLGLINQFSKGKYRRPNIKEGLALGAQYPDLQREGPIAILCEPWRGSGGGVYVPGLGGSEGSRYLSLHWWSDVWPSCWRFAAVRK